MAKSKSWQDKVRMAKPPHVVVLEKSFAGVPAGKSLLIPSPVIIADYMRSIPAGEVRDIPRLRVDLSNQHASDATCPVTTSIFARMVAEATLEELAAGKTVSELVPFWRVIDEKSPIAAKLSCGIDFVRIQRTLERA
ncbi:MAG: hypothetical protein ING72_07285 [Methylobacterium sp.]|jgi:hypothetical protein|nr:hypothetical protein [Methylobacterium sp.]MCA3604369.1 hypothetical protein [Methylobacterium sp.]MCA3612568.1 hypothetical protein [Methylobacterium sp.]MCA4910130.1 hypothetical protein [Methylobacterium sp.]